MALGQFWLIWGARCFKDGCEMPALEDAELARRVRAIHYGYLAVAREVLWAESLPSTDEDDSRREKRVKRDDTVETYYSPNRNYYIT
eukprot:5593491-Amphidinium_carterae.1